MPAARSRSCNCKVVSACWSPPTTRPRPVGCSPPSLTRRHRPTAAETGRRRFTPHPRTEILMTGTLETAVEIRPFHVDIPDEALEDLRRRIAATNWPEKETVADQSQGVPLAMMQALAEYWRTEYDWRRCETRLNDLRHFLTEIDGLDIHFLHARS